MLTSKSYFCLFTCLFISALLGQGIRYSNIYLYHFLLALCSCSVIYFYGIKKCVRELNQLLPLVAFFLYAVMSTLTSINISQSFAQLAMMSLGYLLIYFICFYSKDEERLEKLIMLAVFALALQLIIGLTESMTSFRYPISRLSSLNYFFGVESDGEAMLVKNVKHIAALPTGTLWGASYFGFNLVLILPFVYYFVKSRLVQLLIFLSCLFLLYRIDSKAAYVGVSCIITLILFLEWRCRKLSLKIIVVSLLLAVTCLLYMKVKPAHIKEIKRFSHGIVYGVDNSSNRSPFARARYAANALSSFKENKLLGIGLGQSASPAVQNTGERISLHFYLLELLVELGFVGFSIFISFYAWVVLNLLKFAHAKQLNVDRSFAKACCISMLVFIPGHLEVSSSVYFLPWYYMFGLSIAAVHLYKRKEQATIDRY